jgi:hypothetical protein
LDLTKFDFTQSQKKNIFQMSVEFPFLFIQTYRSEQARLETFDENWNSSIPNNNLWFTKEMLAMYGFINVPGVLGDRVLHCFCCGKLKLTFD